MIDNADANGKKDDHKEANGSKERAQRLKDSGSSILLKNINQELFGKLASLLHFLGDQVRGMLMSFLFTL